MARWSFFYLIRIEFLGFRFHGWQKQAELKSVQGMIDKTFSFIFQHNNYRTLGSGRTDAKVSADDFAFELFTQKPIDVTTFLAIFNPNLPSDIKAKSIRQIDANFNIIQQAKSKEYHYRFSYGEKMHPFNAPFMCDFGKELNIPKMQEATRFFVGKHNFKRYACKPTENTIFEREIENAIIERDIDFSGSLVPPNCFQFKVKSKGFMRYQVRLMMGTLVDVGRGIWSLDDIKESLENYEGAPVKHIAPSSGLKLYKIEF